jgi:hypothetical protein
MDISFPSSTTEPCVELSMSKHWGRQIQPNPLITLTLPLKYFNKYKQIYKKEQITLLMVRQNANLTGNCLLTIVKGSSLDLSCIGMRGRKTLSPFWVPTATSHSRTRSIILRTIILVPFRRLLLGPPEIIIKVLI